MWLKSVSRARRFTALVVLGVTLMGASGCDLNSELAKRFREVWIPGVTSGLSSIATDPVSNAESGLRATLVAMIQAFGAVFTPRNSTSSTTSAR